MNLQKFTQKSIEAIGAAQSLATQNQNSEVDEEHLLLALLEQDESLIKELLKAMGMNSENFENDIRMKVKNKPRMTGGATLSRKHLCCSRCEPKLNLS